jgi:quercetin dioxygenase-like cupin family protein
MTRSETMDIPASLEETTPQVLHVRAGEGIALWVPEEAPEGLVDGQGPQMSTYTFVATEDTTGGALSVVYTVVPPGNGPPPHSHADADESFYILEGAFEVRSGGRSFTARPGDYVFVPRGSEHIWKNQGSQTARMLRIYTPGGMEKFFLEIGREAVAGQPTPTLTRQDVERAESAARRHYG